MSDPSAERPLLLPDHFTEEDVHLVGDAIGSRSIARIALRVLSAAGRLLPPEVDREEEWTYTYRHSGDGQVRSGEDGGELYETRAEVEAQFAFWAQQYPNLPRQELRCVRRDVFTGPWVEVDGSPE